MTLSGFSTKEKGEKLIAIFALCSCAMFILPLGDSASTQNGLDANVCRIEVLYIVFYSRAVISPDGLLNGIHVVVEYMRCIGAFICGAFLPKLEP